MPRLDAVVRFLRECYEADMRATGVTDLLDSSVGHLHFPLFAGELLRGALEKVPLERTAALAAARAAELNRTEKSLMLGAFLIVFRPPGERRTLAAPLLLMPAAVEDASPYAFIRVEPEQCRVNARALSRMLGEGGSARAGELSDRLGGLPLRPEDVGLLVAAVREAVGELDAEAMSSYPTMLDGAAVRSAVAAHRGRPRLLPAAAVALLPNSPDTRTVLAELASIAAVHELPLPLSVLLGADVVAKRRRPAAPVLLPATLSAAQRAVLDVASCAPLTVVIGPPGTGKSYTIAALALDHALRGLPVLIGARTERALDVLSDKLQQLAGGELPIIRGGRGERMRTLRAMLDRLRSTPPEPAQGEPRRSRRRLQALGRDLANAERRLERRATAEERWGELEAARSTGWRDRLQRWWLERRLSGRAPHWVEVESYQRLLAEARAASAALVRATAADRVATAASGRRDMLAPLARALRARTVRTLETHYDRVDMSALLAAFPVWMTTLAEVGELLPLRPGLFELAVVDEATHSDMASALPLLYRARRIAITGDGRQLRHVSFLSDAAMHRAAGRAGIGEEDLDALHWRRRSLLDLASAAHGERVVLTEHFRSQPQIIGFSNRELYGGELLVMTQRPETCRRRAIELRRVEGRRRDDGTNREEADAVLAELQAIVDAQSTVRAAHSLGVLSPFRDQADHLAAEIGRRIDLGTIARHRLLVGTAHAFQGEERDVMLLSLAVDALAPPGSVRFLSREDVLNVAITRARDRQVVFTSLPEDAAMPPLLTRYLRYAAAAPALAAGAPVDDIDLSAIASTLRRRGMEVWPAFPVAGREVDLIVERGGTTLGVDLVGFPGRFREAFTLERTRILDRAGLRVFPLPYAAWRRDPERCLAALEDWLGGDRSSREPLPRSSGQGRDAHGGGRARA